MSTPSAWISLPSGGIGVQRRDESAASVVGLTATTESLLTKVTSASQQTSPQQRGDIVAEGSRNLEEIFNALELDDNQDFSLPHLPPPDSSLDIQDDRQFISSTDIVNISSDRENTRHQVMEVISTISSHSANLFSTRADRYKGNSALKYPHWDVFTPSGLYFQPTMLKELSPFPKSINTGMPKPGETLKWLAIVDHSKERRTKLNPLLPHNHRLILDLLESQAFGSLQADDYGDAEGLYRTRIMSVENTAEANSMQTLRSKVMLCKVLCLMEKDKESFTLFRNVHAKLQKSLPMNHPLLYESTMVEGYIAGRTHDFAYREQLFRDLVQQDLARYGPRNVETVQNLLNFALSMDRTGKDVENERLLRNVIRLYGLLPEYAWSEVNKLGALLRLCIPLYNLDRVAELKESSRQAKEMAESILGPNHSITLEADLHIAHSLEMEGRFEESEALLRSLLDKQKQKYGLVDPDYWRTLWTAFALGELLVKKERSSEAIPLFEWTLKGLLGTQGVRWPDMYESFCALVEAYDRQGRWEDTRKCYKETVETLRGEMGEGCSIVGRLEGWARERWGCLSEAGVDD